MYKYVELTRDSFIEMLNEYENDRNFKPDEKFSDEIKGLIYDYLEDTSNFDTLVMTDSTLFDIYNVTCVYKDLEDYNTRQKEMYLQECDEDDEPYEDETLENIESTYTGFIPIPNSNGFITMSDPIDGGVFEGY